MANLFTYLVSGTGKNNEEFIKINGKRNIFSIMVADKDSNKFLFTAMSTALTVDCDACDLSLLLPTHDVVVIVGGFEKCRWNNGNRQAVRAMSDFVSDLTPEQIKCSQFLCSKTRDWV